jgi:mannose-1-phosphate guanylyltransferase/mannose-6-phosphate isomerase
LGPETLLQGTVRRYLKRFAPEEIFFVTSRDYEALLKAQVGVIDGCLKEQVVLEPAARNTGPAIVFALEEIEGDTFLISPSDHLLAPEELFLDSLSEAEKLAHLGHHVTFGVRPSRPETGYGYIEVAPHGEARFVEKPDRKVAEQFVKGGRHFWNSGMFLFHRETLWADLQRHAPELLLPFFKKPALSIDYALMEKSDKIRMMPLKGSWSDVGSWDSLYEVIDKDAAENGVRGDVTPIDTERCLILGDRRVVGTIGLQDLFIVDTEDALLVGKRGSSQEVKRLLTTLIAQGKSSVATTPATIYRPWGHYTVLEEGSGYKMKKIVIDPKGKLSLQRHEHRSEHWVVIRGVAHVTIGEREMSLVTNESVFVPQGEIHRLENRGEGAVEIIEVQVGAYVGEDDIVRYDDVYGRATCTDQLA